MSIDRTKPWYPTDYTKEEVAASVENIPFFGEEENERRITEALDNRALREAGPAKIFFDMRQMILKAADDPVISQDPKLFKGEVDSAITTALVRFDNPVIPETVFVINEYAVPVLQDGELLEDSRPVKGNLVQSYWDMVNDEKSTD